MRPLVAVMTPAFDTEGATNATRPAPLTVMLPWFAIAPALAPVMANGPPAMNSAKLLAELMSPVEAIRPATFTLAVAPKNTPFGFRMTTLPLAVRLPSIWLWPPPAATRLTAIAEEFGWL